MLFGFEMHRGGKTLTLTFEITIRDDRTTAHLYSRSFASNKQRIVARGERGMRTICQYETDIRGLRARARVSLISIVIALSAKKRSDEVTPTTIVTL